MPAKLEWVARRERDEFEKGGFASMRIQLATMSALVGIALVVLGCSKDLDDAARGGPLLVVQAAHEQPGSDERGVILVIQSSGGRWLEIEVSRGKLANGAEGACISAPASGALRENTLNLLVFPTQIEAVVTVKLLPDGERLPAASSSAGQSSLDRELGACRIEAQPLKQVIRPVQRLAPLVSGMGGANGAGGLSGTSTTETSTEAGGSAGMGGLPGNGGSAGVAGGDGTGPSGGVTGGGTTGTGTSEAGSSSAESAGGAT